MIVQNMGYYEMIMGQWFNAMLPYGLFMLTDAAHYAVYALAILGMLTDGIRRNLHLTALVLARLPCCICCRMCSPSAICITPCVLI